MKKVAKFINSIYFIIFVNIITVVFWYLKLPLVTYLIYLVLCILIIASNANRVSIAAIIMSAIISYQVDASNYLDFHKIYAKMFIPMGIVAIIIFAFDLIKRRSTFRLTPIFYAILGVLVVNILSLVNVRGKDLFLISSLGILQLLAFIIIYVYVLNSQDKDGKRYISSIALITAAAITVQLIIQYCGLGVVSDKGDNNLSWAVSNSIAMFYLVLTPIGLYNYFKDQKKFYIILISGLNVFMMLFMLSRGAYLAIAVITIPAIILLLYITREKKRFLVDLGATFIICIVLTFTVGVELGLIDMVRDYFGGVNFFNPNGRENLLTIGWDLFKQFPIFGAGSYSGPYYIDLADPTLLVGTYHNYIIQTIATTGVLGLISLLYYIYLVIKTSLKKNKYNLLFLISFGFILVHGIVDNSFYNPIIMIFLSCTMPFLESYHEDLIDLDIEPINAE